MIFYMVMFMAVVGLAAFFIAKNNPKDNEGETVPYAEFVYNSITRADIEEAGEEYAFIGSEIVFNDNVTVTDSLPSISNVVNYFVKDGGKGTIIMNTSLTEGKEVKITDDKCSLTPMSTIEQSYITLSEALTFLKSDTLATKKVTILYLNSNPVYIFGNAYVDAITGYSEEVSDSLLLNLFTTK